MPLRVAMIADHPTSPGQIDGGVQAVTTYLAQSLANHPDVELHVISLKHGIERAERIEFPGYICHVLPTARFGTATLFAGDQIALNKLLSTLRPDVVHSQGGGHHGVLAMRSRYPRVVTIHGIMTREAAFLPGWRRRWRTRMHGWLGDYYCIRHGRDTILISPYVADHYRAVIDGRQHLIPNPVDDRFFAVTRRETPGRVLFAGRLYQLKGVKDLFRAAALTLKAGHSDMHLVLAGALSDRRYIDELRALSGELGLSARIDFRGVITTDALLDELARAACLVLPSYQETAPMVIQEAMAAGVPVIASKICGIPYQIEHGETGLLVPPGDIPAIADALSALLSSPARRTQFSDAARKRAEAEYRAARVADRTLAVYREAIAADDGSVRNHPLSIRGHGES
jgi:glycosyltransferase involved in cell wall biosynthesis